MYIFNRKANEKKVTEILLKYSGSHAVKINSASLNNYETNLKNIFDRLAVNEPLEIVLPGFPYKSANTKDKVMSALPDLGELEALSRLSKLCCSIENATDIKTKMIICSDGFAFNDLKGVSDENVLRYRKSLINMASFFDITVKSLNDFDPRALSASTKREKLMHDFGRTTEDLKDDIIDDPSKRILYTNLKAFAEHDLIRMDHESGKAFRRRCSAIVFNVMARSEAWAGLIKNHHPNALRLTIHPYTDVSDKFPVMLVPSLDGRWRTPWHNCPVIDGNTAFTTKVKLAPRKILEEDDARLNVHDGRPWCYTSKSVAMMEDVMMYAM